MKKMTIYLCAGLLIFGLTACGKDAQGDGSSQGTEQTGSSGAQQESGGNSQEGSDNASAGASEDGSDTVDGQPGNDGDGSDDGQQESDGAQEGWSQEMEELRTAVVDLLGEDYWPDMTVAPDMLESLFGITSDMYEDYMGEIPMMSAHVDTLVIVKAKDGQLDAVREALEAYRDTQINNTLQYPMNLAKVQASKVEVAGSYVIFTMLGGDDTAAEEEGEEAQIAYCQEKNDQVINAIKVQLGL